ncbi:MAG: hypothetical protein IPO82_15495 [Betaproteobacteria bacterium]|nr:hypothetical protein [Betaproteobacteria bacterium]
MAFAGWTIAAQALAPLDGALSVVAGDRFTCATTSSSGLRCWGLNGDGQLGDGTGTTRLTPVGVVGNPAIAAVAAGGAHACALSAAGAVTCWGSNSNGQLGNAGVPVAPALNASSPVPVTVSVGEATGIAAGRAHTCTIASGTGAVHCWGANAGGQLGDNSTTDRPTPVQVSGLTGVLALAAGGDRTCALMTGGAVKCWGLNTSGELGTGPGPANQTTPAEIPGLTGVSAITAGDQHVCALATGAVKCWGVNGNGQLGNDSTAQSNIPLDVPGVSGATVVSAGGAHTCALIGGAAKCWGRNANGQLGDGSTEQRLTPVDVVGTRERCCGPERRKDAQLRSVVERSRQVLGDERLWRGWRQLDHRALDAGGGSRRRARCADQCQRDGHRCLSDGDVQLPGIRRRWPRHRLHGGVQSCRRCGQQ